MERNIPKREGQERDHRSVDDIDSIGIWHQKLHEPSLAVEKVTEDIDQANAHAEAKKRFPEGDCKRLPMPAAEKRRMIRDGAAGHYEREP